MTSSQSPSQPTPLLELRDITKTYFLDHTAIPVLHGINLTLYPGEFVALRGASGSGKSTLMNILGCLDHPSSGQYWLHGRDISNLGRDERTHLRRETFGFIFQSYHLIASMTALANVEIPAIYHGVPAQQRHQRAHALLTALGLGERIRSRPNQLSGGQQQRVSIARALMNGGAIILADEPTGALDSHSGAEVMRLLQQLSAQGHTIILITHDPEIAGYAQRCIEMKDGVIVSDYRQTPAHPAPNATQPSAITPKTTAPIPERSGFYSYWAEIYEASLTALRALSANWFRSLLTLLGIVIGVASVIAMLAVGEGARQQVLARISAMGTDLLLVRSGAPNQRGRSDTATLLPADAIAIAELPNVLAAVPEASGAITVRYQDKDSRTSATATSEQFAEARQWPVAEGSFFTTEDVRRFATVVVLGKTVAQALFGPADPVGQYIIINNLLFQVIGVMSGRGASPWGSDQDDMVWVPITTGGLRLFGQSYLRSITVKMADTAQMTTTTTQVDQVLMQRHGILDFNIRNMASLVETEAEAQQTLTLLLGSIAAISLLVGGIGVMNIMLVSVTERTREIGIRMATGARTRNILQQFMIEALVVSAVGGVLGVLFGLGAAWVLQYFEMPVIFSSSPIILALACALGTGLVFGWLPAHKAARLDPVTALASK